MNHDFFLIGVDGGGTGTRVVLSDAQGRELAQAASGPSGLGLGIPRAWQSIQAACGEAFERAGVALDWSRCVLGCGLAGVNNRDWLAEFHEQAPRLAGLAVESDAYTTLLGAHDGAAGVIVALGTGSVAASLASDGEFRMASGYGFPSGDEASGAWLGLRLIVHAQQALDGRAPVDDLAHALLAHTGTEDRDSLVVWLCAANQTAYARLAPIAIEHRAHPFAARLLGEAGVEVGKMIAALDATGSLPVALCGGLGVPLREYVPQVYQARLREPRADSAHGGLQLARREAQRLAGRDL
ncbi:BadF/BadG/BcrA/BcrD ATPase family protein [Paraburkholderia atlantica]|uniref:ATPase BadF/BadG/BcrA/BcrD type n=1 Tax=Paraburkholderia atlantica TaxID=2654982 RepID=D5W6I5_PARAM|nr:BadF/BadG/BcrA/BcrD ATPase family protein [Paraburkholderia atlantica]ADG17106.1 ATPase BadF/BadG/BcrA/BcrD type [Paraburkholderia atlantica]MBB5506684.1 glucosamine kinase [Paraburkholderia atlantica]